MKNAKNIVLLIIYIFLFCRCSFVKEEKKYVIGLSQCMLDDAWRQTMIREVRIEAANYDHLELVIRNADTNNRQQIMQIRELIDMKVDVLIISPNESEPLTAVAEEAFTAGIPTIITDRKVNTELYTTFVGASNYEIGRNAGHYATEYLPPDAVILEIWGLSTSSPAKERHDGFVEALAGRPDITFIKLEGEWRYDTASVRIARMELPERIDFVYAHNDMMAIAAREFFMKRDSVKGKELHIIGVDAVPGAGLEAVADGRINTSFMYPTGAEQIIRAAVRLAEGKAVEHFIPLQTALVDKSVARTLLLQSDQLINYQQRIETQRSRIDLLFDRFGFLQSSLLIISVLMIAFVILTVYAFYINRKMTRTNRILREINKKEEEQRHKLVELNAEIKEVTAQKLQFFTNVSHEVRTPLTLILSPLDRLIDLLQDSAYLDDLLLIRKNADRLLRVINQLLDFRKIENQQEKLKLKELNIINFTREVMTYFDSMAAVRGITYKFISDIKECKLRLDTDMMEKVLVNLLSNAFKFTPENGAITVCISRQDDRLNISIEDNGRGIDKENIPYLFDRFYTGSHSSGTGIGLHLVKEYIRMHKGDVAVESEPGKHTRFTISLRVGKGHPEGEQDTEYDRSPLSYEASQLDDSGIKEMLNISYPYTILIVEDDDEVRAYLEKELKEQFAVLVASTGAEAVSVLEEKNVSLVLSDVMMPDMNGFELCRYIKTTLSFSHIPVILLTALTDERQRLYGVFRGADSYIQKPFHIQYVKVKIVRLLEDRKTFREQLLQKLQENHLLLAEPEKAENIDDKFLRRFLMQIEDVYTDSEYNIERLSGMLGLSRGHLHRKIKELTGVSPVDFLRDYRLKKAAVLIKQQHLSISEVAYRTGFSSPAYFSKCFKVLYGMTPKEYQEND
ncbi:MAG: substrate-binding domain-containing protein [Dysgonamonadaceae bacterium]|jgi:signal transduction histidine kinase/CheY-like chemotaxis protein|nr:substrate-binding domain-containing protein [Dysgonamonadaceae bacterium]